MGQGRGGPKLEKKRNMRGGQSVSLSWKASPMNQAVMMPEEVWNPGRRYPTYQRYRYLVR